MAGETITSKLPNELLADIFGYVLANDDSEDDDEQDKWLRLFLVCKRWRDVAEPFLYRRLYHRLELGNGSRSDELAIDQWIEMLESRTRLCHYPRSSKITLRRSDETICAKVTKIVTYCRQIRELDLYAELEPNLSSLLHQIETLPLTHFRLCGPNGDPSVDTIFKYFDIPSLRHMTLSRWGWSKDGDLATPWL